jgi:hypothetical protein
MHRVSLRDVLTGLVSTALFVGFTAAAGAAPTDAVVVTTPPSGQGAAFVPGTRPLDPTYVEAEYLVAGNADLFTYANDPPLGPTDITVSQADVPYQTRMIVRRPASPDAFNGTVVIEWWNSTAGFDTAPAWDASAEHFQREGSIYVGVTNSTTSLAFLTGGCRLLGVLPPSCGTRYATLSLPENGLAYEMMSQIANLLKSASASNPIPSDYPVERLYHTGQSQQGGSVITYASAFHFPVNDGYFVQQAATARAINFGPACGAAGSLPYPDCTPRLAFPDNLVRTDLPVPVLHAISETDIEILFGTAGRQADTPTFRYYEIAGGSHLTVHEDIELIPAGLLGPDPILLEDLCLFGINSTADGPVFVSYVLNALWEALEDQVQWGDAPPAGRIMDVVGGVVQRDGFGNGLGGVRPPAVEAPIATYTPGNVADPSLPPFLQNIGNLACFLASSVSPFDDATLDTLYPNHGAYVSRVIEVSNQARLDGFLLTPDRAKIVTAAAGSPIGCGMGFEVTLLLPGLLWWKQRRRKARGQDVLANRSTPSQTVVVAQAKPLA